MPSERPRPEPLPRLSIAIAAGLLMLLVTGCGDANNVMVTGTLYRQGAVYEPQAGERVMIVFDEEQAGKATGKSFPTTLNNDGTFKLAGPDNKGIPRGKYRVGVLSSPQAPKPGSKSADKFDGRYDPTKTPIQVEVSPSNRVIKVEIE